jgi:carboxyl-terminal processing protease
MRQKRRFNFAQTVFFSLLLLIGMFLGFKFHVEIGSLLRSKTGNKIDQVFNLVDKKYVDTVDLKKLESETIEGMLSQLDPHSVYIPAEDVKKSNEDLEGNFEGIGVEFFIVKDTIYVVSVIPGGPSEKLGIKAGDKIVKVNGKIVAGKKIKNAEVTGSLRGPSNSFVKISVKRIGIAKLIDFNIQRGNVPLNSLDAAYMAAPGIGYIKINTFAATTYDEFFEGITKLKKQGLKSLILDLRGNPGGYLSAAIMIADEFLTAKKLIVYTEGKSSPKKEDFATAAGNFEKGKLIVLVDEAQFFTDKQIWDLANLVDNWNINVYCYGLRLDWQGNFFTGSETLFKIADVLEPVENLCKYNKGAPAYFHVKLSGSDASVEVGAEDMYESVSRKTWREWQTNKKPQ